MKKLTIIFSSVIVLFLFSCQTEVKKDCMSDIIDKTYSTINMLTEGKTSIKAMENQKFLMALIKFSGEASESYSVEVSCDNSAKTFYIVTDNETPFGFDILMPTDYVTQNNYKLSTELVLPVGDLLINQGYIFNENLFKTSLLENGLATFEYSGPNNKIVFSSKYRGDYSLSGYRVIVTKH